MCEQQTACGMRDGEKRTVGIEEVRVPSSFLVTIISKNGRRPSSSISTANYIDDSIELRYLCKRSNTFAGNSLKGSSMYRFQKISWQSQEDKALYSTCSINILATVMETGEPIAVSKICCL